MKYTVLVFALSLSFFLFNACGKAVEECVDVEYTKSFTIEKEGKYCLPDGNYFEVEELENGFCPCNVICIWEGEMILFFEAEFNGKEFSGSIGSSENTPKSFVDESYEMHFSHIEFEVPCSENVPSPKIISADVLLIQK